METGRVTAEGNAWLPRALALGPLEGSAHVRGSGRRWALELRDPQQLRRRQQPFHVEQEHEARLYSGDAAQVLRLDPRPEVGHRLHIVVVQIDDLAKLTGQQ